LYEPNPLEKLLASALSGGLRRCLRTAGDAAASRPAASNREGGEQMKKYSKPVVKTVEKGTIFAAMA
jgi:hypothetical protein